jgi:hypothetical protein
LDEVRLDIEEKESNELNRETKPRREPGREIGKEAHM